MTTSCSVGPLRAVLVLAGPDDDDVYWRGRAGHRAHFKANRFPNGMSWQWTLTYDENRSLTHGYEPTREAAMQAFARSWHREA
jgi:hypothetical protein